MKAVCCWNSFQIFSSSVLEARAVLDTDKIKRLTDRIGGALKDGFRWRRIRELVCGASLAHHGLLGSVRDMSLSNEDLSPVPVQHLASLLTCVTRDLSIDNVSGCDLVSLFTNIKCQELSITSQSLGREETQALVQAMEYRVEAVVLYKDVELDIESLSKYIQSGQGSCKKLILCQNTAERYTKELKTFRGRIWRVIQEHDKYFVVTKRFL